MVWSKGIQTFYDIASEIKKDFPDYTFTLVGDLDLHNPDCDDKDILIKWQNEGVLNWHGHQKDIASFLKTVGLIVFPSTYGEGVPKCLIEAASCGKPIITYDLPGCSDIVKNNLNGFLIKPGNTSELIKATKFILESPSLSEQFAKAGRERVKSFFSEDIIIPSTLNLYK